MKTTWKVGQTWPLYQYDSHLILCFNSESALIKCNIIILHFYLGEGIVFFINM